MSRRDLWEEMYERFDPDRPADSRWRAERPHSPAQRIISLLNKPFGTPRVLVAGTVGTGKTTELRRVAEAREGHELVVFLDLERHFAEVVCDQDALQRIQSWEVCFLAGMALIATAHATETPSAQLDIASLARSMASVLATAAPAVVGGPAGVGMAAGLSLVGGAAGSVTRWNLPLGRSKRSLPDQDTSVRTLVGCVNTLMPLINPNGSTPTPSS